MTIVPGEWLPAAGELELNPGRRTLTVVVANTGDRPIQVGSHFHFFETNPALDFDRAAARGFRLNIAAGTAVRFEPGERREVELVELAGDRIVYGFNAAIMGPLDRPAAKPRRPAARSPARPAAKTAGRPVARSTGKTAGKTAAKAAGKTAAKTTTARTTARRRPAR